MEKLEQGVHAGKRLMKEAGFPPLAVIRPMKGGHYAVLRFIERFDKATETERVRVLNVALGGALMELGFVPYKCPALLYEELYKRLDPGFVTLMDRLRDAIDPKRILNPDRWRP
jgi:FAD/FMN-containing dehydrogenase